MEAVRCSTIDSHVIESTTQDIQHVVDMSEEMLRCLIFTLLGKVIEQESANGQLDFSSIEPNILKEIKFTRKYAFECKLASGNDFDMWVRHKIMDVLEEQVNYTIKTYHKTFYKLTAELDLTDEFSFAYNTFVRVCKKLFLPEITWYHIVALLCFGAEIAVFVIKQGGPGVQSFLNKIVHYVTEFIIKEEIADWISKHGGWIKMINFIDKEDCPDRAAHILTVMTVSEYTHLEMWLQGIAVAGICAGLVWTVGNVLFNRK